MPINIMVHLFLYSASNLKAICVIVDNPYVHFARGFFCAVEVGSDMRRRSTGRDEDLEELQRRRQLQEEQLMKVTNILM